MTRPLLVWSCHIGLLVDSEVLVARCISLTTLVAVLWRVVNATAVHRRSLLLLAKPARYFSQRRLGCREAVPELESFSAVQLSQVQHPEAYPRPPLKPAVKSGHTFLVCGTFVEVD
jgi:hypothetical protein